LGLDIIKLHKPSYALKLLISYGISGLATLNNNKRVLLIIIYFWLSKFSLHVSDVTMSDRLGSGQQRASYLQSSICLQGAASYSII
jgi:hypothetical protein